MKTIQEFIKYKIKVLDAKYPNAIPVFGGALWVYNGDVINNENFVNALFTVADNARFFNWHESPAQAMRRFCNICMMDSEAIELCLGMKFEDICREEE